MTDPASSIARIHQYAASDWHLLASEESLGDEARVYAQKAVAEHHKLALCAAEGNPTLPSSIKWPPGW